MTINIFIGFDPNEAIAYHVLAHSIMHHASEPVSITPINLQNLQLIYNKERHPAQSTEFSMSRFLTPHLGGRDWSIFMDCDMLVLGDIVELYDHRQFTKAVQVVKHDYTPCTETKFLNQKQSQYARKNWSSVMLFNGNHMACRNLTPDKVDGYTGMELHQFKWCENEDVGELPVEWNFLEGEYKRKDYPGVKLVHYTLGGPYFDEYKDCEFAEEWREMYARTIHATN
jgi:lipopolysaccharide biosynthesis glycosyltransferase